MSQDNLCIFKAFNSKSIESLLRHVREIFYCDLQENNNCYGNVYVAQLIIRRISDHGQYLRDITARKKR